MINYCEKFCENLGAKFCEKFCEKLKALKNLCKKATFSPLFNKVSTILLNNSLIEGITKTFPQFHKPYYHYYDILKINNIRKV